MSIAVSTSERAAAAWGIPPDGQYPEFTSLLDTYVKWMRRRRLSENTIRLRVFYVRKFERWLPVHVLRASIDDLEAYTGSPRWTPATQQTVISAMRSFYGWAQRMEHTDTNLAAELYNIRVNVKRSRIAADARIIAGLEAASTAAEAAMIRLGAECGLRVSEIASLKLADRDEDWITVIGKGGKQRTVHLEPELMALLDKIEETTMRHGNYFPGQSGRKPVSPSTVWRHVRDLVGVNTHALRHRAGTTVYRGSGNDLRLAQEFLGHSSPVTTARYVHVEDADLRRAGGFARLAGEGGRE